MEYINSIEAPRHDCGEKKRKAQRGGRNQFALPESSRRPNERLRHGKRTQRQ